MPNNVNHLIIIINFGRGNLVSKRKRRSTSTSGDAAGSKKGSSAVSSRATECTACMIELPNERVAMNCGHALCVRCAVTCLERHDKAATLQVARIVCPSCLATSHLQQHDPVTRKGSPRALPCACVRGVCVCVRVSLRAAVVVGGAAFLFARAANFGKVFRKLTDHCTDDDNTMTTLQQQQRHRVVIELHSASSHHTLGHHEHHTKPASGGKLGQFVRLPSLRGRGRVLVVDVFMCRARAVAFVSHRVTRRPQTTVWRARRPGRRSLPPSRRCNSSRKRNRVPLPTTFRCRFLFCLCLCLSLSLLSLSVSLFSLSLSLSLSLSRCFLLTLCALSSVASMARFGCENY